MKVQKSIKLAHTSSVLISMVVNGLLVLALLTFITFSQPSERETTTVMVIDPVAQEDIDELEEEIEPEEVVDPDELDELVDFTLDTPMDTNFEQETEVVEDVTNTDVSSLSELMSDVSSPVVMTGLLVGRTPRARQAAAAKYGKGLEKFSEPAVMKALEWLRDNQHPNGSWNKDGGSRGGFNTGYTGLALLAFLAHGETPASAEFGPTVAKAIRFLVENQDAKGVLQPSGAHTGYGHALGTYALAEAYTMTENILLREPLQRAVKVIINGQMPNGGYDYDYKKEDRNDLSLASWQLQALKAASISGVAGPDTKKYLQSAMDGMLSGSKKTDAGRFFTYSVNGGNVRGPQKTVSAAGTLALFLSGRGRSSEAKEALEFLSQYTENETLPNWGSEKSEGHGGAIYYWYYAVQAFFQEDPDGSNFRRFMPALVKALAQNQASDGHWLCYSEGGAKQGKTLNTAMGALGLMVYYRYLPTTQADNIQQADTQTVPGGPGGGDEEDVGFEI
ncbi:MAG: prenyltransferase/squalene oxidase repeat-containing protein [Kiritimatiellia bacterium]